MKVLVVGSGGREHALAWKLSKSAAVDHVYCVPGNAGIARDGVCIGSDYKDPEALAALAESLKIDLTVVGPEGPLVEGIVDLFRSRNLLVAGPVKAAAQLEGSKIFAKEFMRRHGIPTGDFVDCDNYESGRSALKRWGGPVVLKADGLAAGKGVVVCSDIAEADAALESLLSGKLVGPAGHRVLLEQWLCGEEVSFLVLTDGKTVLPLLPTQDHKRVYDGDAGPNTGGMGAYSDDSIVSNDLHRRIMDEIVHPTIDGLASEGITYRGVLYCGLMITPDGPMVLEYNARFGDPETQALMVRMNGDLAEALAATARGELQPDMLSWFPGASVCLVACSGGYPGPFEKGKQITGLPEAEANGAKVFHARTAKQHGSIVTAGGRVLGITAEGSDLAEAAKTAYAAASKIHFDGMHYRRDIGYKGLRRLIPL